jgi:uncharacterized membrane protein YfcA
VTAGEYLAVLAAGGVAGMVNTIVGSGSLVTFPTLLAVGYPSVTANVSNTVGLVFGGVSGVIGYRRELEGQKRRAAAFGCFTAAGALTGGILLLTLPTSVFDAVVPVLILFACSLMAFKNRLTPEHLHGTRGRLVPAGASAFFTGIYGGYFGAAQGIILMSLLALFLPDGMQRLNALKNVLALVANAVAALLFVFAAHVAWEAAATIAVGSILGAQLGATVGRRIPDEGLRWTVVVGGTIVAIILILT